MGHKVSDIAFTPAVKAVQEQKGSRAAYERMAEKGGWSDTVTDELATFIAARDSFYFATASADGQPYVQHRGGPAGFLKTVGERQLAFADYSGNRQYISTGNLSENNKAYLFLMDYPNRRRIKVWGHARVVEDDPDLLASVAGADTRNRAEHVIVFDITGWDVNCPQYITPRFTAEDMDNAVQPLKQRIAALEARLSRHARPDDPETIA